MSLKSSIPTETWIAWPLAALLLGGCIHPDLPWLRPANGPVASDESHDKKPAPTSKSTSEKAEATALAAGPRALLQRGGWYRVQSESEAARAAVYDEALPAQPAAPSTIAAFHYRHEGVEQLAARPPANKNELLDLLSDSDRLVAATAAVALARLGSTQVAPQLIAAIENEQLPIAARAGAVEALGLLPGKDHVETLGRLADEYGQYIPGASAGYQAELHAELLRALARHVDAADDPRFAAAVEVPSPLVKIEALRAWGAGKRGIVPMSVADLRSDDDPRVRAAALEALASRKYAEAFDDLTAALRDVDLSVRLAAIHGLGELGDTRSLATLGDLLKDRGELVRAAAVATLAAHGPRAVVLGAAADKSWRVRLEVAKALASFSDAEGLAAARRMLNDESAEVERQVVRTLAAWPPEAALPVLLDALDRDAVSVRKLAADQIASRWPGSPRFPYESPPARRAQALAELREKLGGADVSGTLRVPNSDGTRSVPDTLPDEQVEKLLAAGDFHALVDLGTAVVPALERLAIDRHATLPEAVYRDVLPRQSAVFAALGRLHGSSLNERRSAVGDIAVLGRKGPLGRLAAARLCDLMASESDAIVWLRALDVISADGSEPALRTARMALGQSTSEVRRRGCEYLAAHPDPAHEAFLLPCAADSEEEVAVAALGALAAAGRIDDIGAIKRLLSSPREAVQLAAAMALVPQRDPAGEETILRLSYSTDIKLRGQLARALGDLGDARFTAVLIRLLDDSKATVSHAALASLPRVAGRDVGKADDGSTPSMPEQVARWKKWYATANDVKSAQY